MTPVYTGKVHHLRVWSKPSCDMSYSNKKVKIEVNPLPGLRFAAWEEDLGEDPDREFILHRIEHGFDIIDEDAQIIPVTSPIHPSAQPKSPLYEKASYQVLKEIQHDNYVVCKDPPKIVSHMAAIPKPDGEVRLIHGCSLPIGEAVNDYCSTDWQQKFARVDDAAKVLTEGCYFAKVHIRSAYRSVKISKRSQEVTGLVLNINGQKVFPQDT